MLINPDHSKLELKALQKLPLVLHLRVIEKEKCPEISWRLYLSILIDGNYNELRISL